MSTEPLDLDAICDKGTWTELALVAEVRALRAMRQRLYEAHRIGAHNGHTCIEDDWVACAEADAELDIEVLLRERIAAEVEAKIEPLLDVRPIKGGYNCCGCSTYGAILDDALDIIRGAS